MDSGLRHRPAVVPFVALVLLFALLAVGTASALVWNITTVTTGNYPSLALDGDNPRLTSSSSAGLQYAANNGSAWSFQTADSNPDIEYSSLALGAAGAPRIAYTDLNSGSLWYAAWTGSAWDTQNVFPDAEAPSLLLSATGTPIIAFTGADSPDLVLVTKGGTTWQRTWLVLSNTRISRDADLAGTGGRLYVSHYDETNGDLRYNYYDGSSWSPDVIVDAGGDVGASSSIALDPAFGYPRIAYYDRTNGNLKFAAWGGTSWTIQTVDSVGDVGGYTSLAMSSNGFAHIAYYDRTNGDLKYASETASGWSIETVDAAGNVGMLPSLAMDTHARPQIAYHASAGDCVKLARAVPSAPSIGIQTEVSVDGGTTWYDADVASGPGVVTGRPVQWRYIVTNTGNVPLVSVWVEDSRDGVTPTAPKTSLTVGESMTATASGIAVAGQQSCTGTVHGTYATLSLDVQGSDPVYWLGLALLAVPQGTAPPTDTDGADELYDDVNGNGRKDFADVVLYFNQMTWIAANEPVSAFDYNGNGRIDFADVVWLFNHL